ncbi:hypothetical protein [Flammeovirga pacifica]|uniref:DUF4062 domain-containing protein n=1 Tax=Flammeovirga pacifica TaxID=915059 RepID=A0A1S1YY72_FLAPC|nr:hypothetical protein [Flammeovirga pacifica]OHX65948.1 hypothetical protein NH26_06045 [Flammeovirga pacifica]
MLIQIVCVSIQSDRDEEHQELGYLLSDALQVSFKEMKEVDIETRVSQDHHILSDSDVVIYFLMDNTKYTNDIEIDPLKSNYKLLLHDLPYEYQPDSLKKIQPYYLSKFETRINKKITLTLPIQEGYRVYFWLLISDLALDIHEYNDRSISSRGQRYLFLGETSDDLRMERILLKRDLKAYGYKLLPTSNYGMETEEISKSQWQDLQKSELSIHLVGGRNGTPSDNDLFSIQEWEEKVSETYVKQNENALKKFVWVPPAIRFQTDKRKFYVEKLLKNIDEHEFTLTFRTDLEKFKSILHGELMDSRHEKDLEDIDDMYKRKVYIMNDNIDKVKAEGLKQKLNSMGFGVLNLDVGQGAKMMRRQHQRHLQLCNSTIIYVDEAPEAWIKAKLQDNLRASGLGRKEPLKIKALVCSSFSLATKLTELLEQNALYQSVGVFTDDDVMISDDLISFLSTL